VRSAASEAVDGVLGEPVADTELSLVAPSPPTAGVGATAAEAPESSSLWPTTPVNETTPATSPSLAAPQEHDAPLSVAWAASLEIQETREGSGAAQR
jgi:hypothetical protein